MKMNNLPELNICLFGRVYINPLGKLSNIVGKGVTSGEVKLVQYSPENWSVKGEKVLFQDSFMSDDNYIAKTLKGENSKVDMTKVTSIIFNFGDGTSYSKDYSYENRLIDYK